MEVRMAKLDVARQLQAAGAEHVSLHVEHTSHLFVDGHAVDEVLFSITVVYEGQWLTVLGRSGFHDLAASLLAKMAESQAGSH
jgi:hypothetical protein